jgi:hypothetical protein
MVFGVDAAIRFVGLVVAIHLSEMKRIFPDTRLSESDMPPGGRTFFFLKDGRNSLGRMPQALFASLKLAGRQKKF